MSEYKELLQARAAGAGISDVELMRARRDEVRAAETAEAAELVARDLDQARAAHAEQVKKWVNAAKKRARPLHADLVKQREVVESARVEMDRAMRAHAGELAKARALYEQISDAVGEHLSDRNTRAGYPGYPTDDDGNPLVETYRRWGQVVLDGEVIGLLKDRPAE